MRRRVLCCVLSSGLVMLLGARTGARADTPVNGTPDDGSEPAKTLPQESFFSSMKQSFLQDPTNEAVRGHFDLGSPPNVRRYYCMVNLKTGAKEPNGTLGSPVPRSDGMTGLKVDSVSLYGCADAERAGMLVTQGYVLTGRAAREPVGPQGRCIASCGGSGAHSTATASIGAGRGNRARRDTGAGSAACGRSCRSAGDPGDAGHRASRCGRHQARHVAG